MMLQTETILMQSKRILHAKTRDRGSLEQRSERKISLLIFPSKAALYLDTPRARRPPSIIKNPNWKLFVMLRL